MTSKVYLACIGLFVMATPAYGMGASDEEASLARAFGDESFISIATGKRQLLSQAPAVASVITADDIKSMGATDLDQILETVPGLHVSVAPRGFSPIYSIRGVYSESNPQVLILINDIPITNLYIGNRNDVWGGMQVNNIARIEIMRGPGSAIYGADAFSGTINIITKTAADIEGTEVGARAGSFNAREGWLLHGGTWQGFDVAFSMEIADTDGHDGIIEVDAQTIYDGIFSTNASLAPGNINLERKAIEARTDISRGDWRLRLGYQGRRDVGMGAGVAFALDPTGSGRSDRFNADITYKTILTRTWDITGQISYFDASAKPDLTLFPAGHVNPISLSAFPDGMVASPYLYERHTRANLSSFFHGIENHNIRLGVGGIHSEIYKVRELKNYGPMFEPLGEIVDATGDPSLVFLQPQDRTIFYAFVQDEWNFAPDWNFTGGVRYDHYSDFGDTTNPRFALVWQTRHDLTTKLLYGRAFRAPAFIELYNINNPVALGNPNLKPETIDTYELAFNYQHSRPLKIGLNLFYYKMRDILRFTPDPAPASTVTAQNIGNRRGHGLEIEMVYEVNSRLQILSNYAFQKSTESESDSDVANTPQHQIYARTNWMFALGWTLNAQAIWIADRKREATDPRPEVDDYIITDLIVRYKPKNRPWEMALAVRNVFDEDAREPSPAPGFIPNDLPLPGRNFFVEARYHFDRF